MSLTWRSGSPSGERVRRAVLHGVNRRQRQRFQNTCRALELWRIQLGEGWNYLLEKLDCGWCSQQLLAPHLLGILGKSGEDWGTNAKGLVFKMQSRAKMDVQQLGENS
jgi:hypothetical protein